MWWRLHFEHLFVHSNSSNNHSGAVVAQAVTQEEQFINEINSLKSDELLEISGELVLTSKIIDTINNLAKTKQIELLIKDGGSLVIDKTSAKDGKVVIEGTENLNFVVGRAEGKKGALITVKDDVDVTFDNSLFYNKDILNTDVAVEGKNVKLTNGVVSDAHFNAENKVESTMTVSEIVFEDNKVKVSGEIKYSSPNSLVGVIVLAEVFYGEGKQLVSSSYVDGVVIEDDKVTFSGFLGGHD